MESLETNNGHGVELKSSGTEPSSKRAPVLELDLSHYLTGTQLQKDHFIQDLFVGLKDCGFIILKNHPIQAELLDQAYRASEFLFSLDPALKEKYVSAQGGGQRGYTAFGTEHAKDQKVPDLKEFWHVGRELDANHALYAHYPQNLWPREIPHFKKVFLKLYAQLDGVAESLLEALTPSLEVSSDHFKHMIRDGNSILRLLHYPPIPQGVDPRCLRAAAHEDINLITILVSASASGLELLSREGQWLEVDTDPANLIVDAGDMLSRVTNEVIPSTTHRVVNPKGANTRRYSMPFFVHPHPQAILSCIESCEGSGARYPDILSEDFLLQRLKEIGLIK